MMLRVVLGHGSHSARAQRRNPSYRTDGAGEPLGVQALGYSMSGGSMAKESGGTGMRRGWDRAVVLLGRKSSMYR